MLTYSFFNRDAITTEKVLLGKIISVQYKHDWLFAQIIETETYFRNKKGSHASLDLLKIVKRYLFLWGQFIYIIHGEGIR